MTFHEGTERLAWALLRKPINKAAIIFLGFYTTLWGLWVVNPFWHVFTTAPLFKDMLNFAPEWAWGIVALIAGAVIIYGAIKRTYNPLIRGALVGSIYWLIVAIFYFMGDWQNTGGITSLTFAVYSSFVYLNIKVNKQHGHEMDELVK